MRVGLKRLASALLLAALLQFLQACSDDSSPPTDHQIQVIPLAKADTHPIVPLTTAIIANSNDAHSMRLAKAYAQKRGIPAENIITVSLPASDSVSAKALTPALKTIQAANADGRFRAYAIAWQKPYRLENQSITSAISMGLSDVIFEGACNRTDDNPAYDAEPGAELDIPLSMMLVGGPLESDALTLVARAGSGDGSNPEGTVHLVRTEDDVRSLPRLANMNAAQLLWGGKIKIELVLRDELRDESGILAYQTGRSVLPGISTLSFLPGAYADTLTSYSGRLTDSHGQTPVTDIMKAGTTASFGTVREPCNMTPKFPRPDLMLSRYLEGDTILEAYWKSVSWISEGLFVGEPLSRPFSQFAATEKNGGFTLYATRLTKPGHYRIYRVETGKPEFLAEIDTPTQFEDGSEIARVPVGGMPEHPDTKIVLGFVRVIEP